MPHKLGEMKAVSSSVTYLGKDRSKSFHSLLQMSIIFNRILINSYRMLLLLLQWQWSGLPFALKILQWSFTPARGIKRSSTHFLSWRWKALCNVSQGFAKAQTILTVTRDPCPAWHHGEFTGWLSQVIPCHASIRGQAAEPSVEGCNGTARAKESRLFSASDRSQDTFLCPDRKNKWENTFHITHPV